MKRMCIKTLPKVLAIHLKRFDYDWERSVFFKFFYSLYIYIYIYIYIYKETPEIVCFWFILFMAFYILHGCGFEIVYICILIARC